MGFYALDRPGNRLRPFLSISELFGLVSRGGPGLKEICTEPLPAMSSREDAGIGKPSDPSNAIN